MRILWMFLSLFLAAGSAAAQSGKAPWEEFGRRIKASQAVTPLGPNLFGDEVSLQNGALSFSATDVSIPGNDALPVAFTRRYQVRDWRHRVTDLMLKDWDVDLPSISGVYQPDWLTYSGSGTRCSINSPPPLRTEYGVAHTDFWQATSLNIPGVGGGELLWTAAGTQTPTTGGPYKWMTNDQIHISCLSTIQNGSGEGFLAVTPDGTKYWFNWMAQYHEPPLRRGDITIQPGTVTPGLAALPVRRNVLYATRVEDRFGNYVTYTYSNAWNQPGRLTQISASDGRQITVSYSGSAISSVTDGSRTWTYGYGSTSGSRGTLTVVNQPDSSAWSIGLGAFTGAEILYSEAFLPGEIYRSCTMNETPLNATVEPVGTITHPSGAVGTFTLSMVEHGRSSVPLTCNNVTTTVGKPLGTGNDKNDDMPFYPISYFALTLKSKAISGVGLTAAQWNYQYEPGFGFYMYPGTTVNYPVCMIGYENCALPPCTSEACAGFSQTTVLGPDGEWVRYRYGNTFRYNEGKLLKVETGTGPSNILRSTTHTYDLSLADQAYKARWGFGQQFNGDSFPGEYHRPLLKTVTVQQGVSFTWQADSFDSFARPLQVARHNTMGYSRTDVTAYRDNLSRWVIGQVATVTNTQSSPNSIVSRTDYDATSDLPIRFYAPGNAGGATLLQQTLTYNTDGTIATAKDGNNKTTTLTNWYRGVPRNIQFPDGTTQSATVNGHGWITGVTDENGYTTAYGYDSMGRMNALTQPAGDAVSWAPTGMTFAYINTAEYGVPAGHWRLTIGRGNYRKQVYYDAMWRPVVEREYDNASVAATQRFKRFAYDADGQVTFASYPGTSATLTTGVWTQYDTLGRVTSVSQDSELGVLTTQSSYLAGFKTRTTNARGFQTTTSFYALDEPDTSAPSLIDAPEGQRTTILRDQFGRTYYVERTGTGAGQTEALGRNYIYDAHHRLCKTVSREEGATHFEYDNGGNIIRTADGDHVYTSDSCSQGSIALAQKSVRTYDARNRLLTVTYPDGVNNTTNTYFPDGKLKTIASGPSTWTYEYNRLRLPTRELLNASAGTYEYLWTYNSLGHQASRQSITANGNPVIAFAPNALGQPTQAGTYATNATYHPSGALQGFTYGNGIQRTVTFNARQMPARISDGAVLDLGYGYDANGNPLTLTNYQAQLGDRDLQYDGLDRLVQAQLHGHSTETWQYDVLDNIKRNDITQGGSSFARVYNYDISNRLTSITQNGAAWGTYVYDGRGNMITRNGMALNFSRANRVTSMAGVANYEYDGHGRRTTQWRSDGTVRVSLYTLDGRLQGEADNRAVGSTDYMYLGSTLVARRFQHWSGSPPVVTYQHTDALGSPVAISNASGQLQSREWFTSYGAPMDGATEDQVGYTGHQSDPVTGLVYAQQRYYDPVIGRFISADPIKTSPGNGAMFNRYWYADGSPYKFTDPDGMCPEGSTKRTCIESTSEKATAGEAKLSEGTRLTARRSAGAARVGAGRREKIGSINNDPKTGEESVYIDKNSTTGTTNTAYRGRASVPRTSVAGYHGHPPGPNGEADLRDDLDSNSLGDAQVLLDRGYPNIAESHDGRQVVHEIVDGRYQVRMINGQFTEAEMKHFNEQRMNYRQEKLNE